MNRDTTHAPDERASAAAANITWSRQYERASRLPKNTENTTCDSHGIWMNAKAMIVENITPSSFIPLGLAEYFSGFIRA